MNRNIYIQKSQFITKGDKMSQARFELDEYTTRVLDVIKGKFGLNNRNEALTRFVHEFGSEFVEPEVDEKFLTELDKATTAHLKKYGYRKMSMKELDKLLG